jgi:hypothetical protein
VLARLDGAAPTTLPIKWVRPRAGLDEPQTPAAVMNAVKLVRSGEIIELAHPLNADAVLRHSRFDVHKRTHEPAFQPARLERRS